MATMSVFVGSETLVTETCYLCGMHFAMPENFHRLCKNKGPKQNFHCPMGHSQVYVKSRVTELEEKLKQERDRAWSRERHLEDQREAAERSARAYKGQVTKIKNRVGHGVCPCCNRTFDDLARHMESKHPDFINE